MSRHRLDDAPAELGTRDAQRAEECRAIAQAKLDEASSNPRQRKSLTAAAEAWMLLAARFEQMPAFDFDGKHPS